MPPPPPKVFFGRDELVQRIVRSAENLTSMALIGTGGIGKTSIVLTVLDDNRVKQRFGDNRLFIRCDRLTPSHTHLLRKLSEAIGAGFENPEDLSPLRRCLSSKEMMIVLDNAESVLCRAETNAQEIHAIVDELSQFGNICLVITSRIFNTLPSHCEIVEIPTLSMGAGQETFYRIHSLGERSDEINDILKKLDFHPLSITLLATIAQQNRWNTKRLATEWAKQRTGVLRARNLGSLAATIELSLTSPMFQELGPNARELLGVIAFFPQGLNEDNVDRMFLKISDVPSMLDIFCNLSLAYRSDGFITMLAPLRDYLRPKDPMASSFLCMAKEHYLGRLSGALSSNGSGSDASRCITSEDVNLEHLLDVFTTIDADSEDVWDACSHFMMHLYLYKPRLVILGPKFEALPDTHPDKPDCLLFLSRMFGWVGNWVEQKRILTQIQSSGFWREEGDADDYLVAETLFNLSDANRQMGLYEEGIRQAREALEIFGRLGETQKQAYCLIVLALLLREDEQLDAAEEAATHALDLSENYGHWYLCPSHHVLGAIHWDKGNMEKALQHYETSLRIASSINLRHWLSQSHFFITHLYLHEGMLDEAHTHIQHAKSHAGDNMFILGQVLAVSAKVLYKQSRPEEAKSEASRALDISEKLGAAGLVEKIRELLEEIEEWGDNGELLEWRPLSSLFIPLILTQSPNLNDRDESCPGFPCGPHLRNLVSVSFSNL